MLVFSQCCNFSTTFAALKFLFVRNPPTSLAVDLSQELHIPNICAFLVPWEFHKIMQTNNLKAVNKLDQTDGRKQPLLWVYWPKNPKISMCFVTNMYNPCF